MLDLKVKNELLKNPVALSQVMNVQEGSDLRFFEIIKSEGKQYLRTYTDNDNQVSELDVKPEEILESLLLLEGKPETLGINYKCSKNAAWVIFGLAELKKRLHMDSLLHGTKEIDVLTASESALKEIKDLAFRKNTDFRMPLGFYQMYLGENSEPDLDAAFKELRESGFMKEDGLFTTGALAIITALANIHSIVAVDNYKEVKKETELTRVMYLNCYHSLWLISPPDNDSQMLICTIGLDELRKDLKSLF